MDIKARGLKFKSWKDYVDFLEAEVRQLQLLLRPESRAEAFAKAKKDVGMKADDGKD